MCREERREGWRTLVVVIVQSFGGGIEKVSFGIVLSFNELQHQKKRGQSEAERQTFGFNQEKKSVFIIYFFSR